MEVVVSEVNEYEGLTIRHQYPVGEPALRSEDAWIEGRPEIDVKVTRDGSRVRFVGGLTARVRMNCDRCLAPVSIAVTRAFDLQYIPPLGGVAVNEERELTDDDLSIGFYRDSVISVDDIVREQIELAIPMSRLCGSDCRGLCPGCRVSLNESECVCAAESVDPRWAALKQWREKN